MALTWETKSDANIDILINGQYYTWVPTSDDWESWWTTLSRSNLNSGQNVIEFRNRTNQNRTSSFTLAEAGPVRISVYNLMGQQIRVLADSWLAAGAHRVRWNGRTDMGAEAASGVYWTVLQVGNAVQTAKLALIR